MHRRLPRQHKRLPSHHEHGIALILLLTMLVLGALYLMTHPLSAERLRLKQSHGIQQDLVQAKEALIGYAATYRDTHPKQVFGYLPCPDLNDDGYAEGNCGKGGEVAVGRLPYKTLRLKEPQDESNGRLWYIVSGEFKNNPPTTPMNWDSRGGLTILGASGHPIASPDDDKGGMAAAIVAAGPQLGDPSFRDIQTPCGNPQDGFLACTIVNGIGYLRLGMPGDPTNQTRGLALSPREIYAQVTRRKDFGNALEDMPAGQINTLILMAQKAFEAKIGADLVALTPTKGSPSEARPTLKDAYTQYPGKWIGDPPSLSALDDENYTAYWKNWSDQFRYVICSDLRPTTPCLTIAGEQCRGALLFSGHTHDGQPRQASQKVPLTSTTRSTYLPHYFEATGALPLLTSTQSSFNGAASYQHHHHSIDVGRCLVPGAFVSASKDIASFIAQASSVSLPEAGINIPDATITLGNPLSSISGSGCIWHPSKLPFHTQLRAYFRFRILDRGEGFTLAVIDGEKNNPLTGENCGDADGQSLGYAGPGITPPKFGLEIDTRTQAIANDPDQHHVAFIFWGTQGDSADDNTHNVGSDGDGNEPLNPRNLLAIPAGIATVKSSDTHLPYSGSLPLDTDIHVRLEATKHREMAAPGSRLSLRAYVATVLGPEAALPSYQPTCSAEDFYNLALDLNELCAQRATIAQEHILMNDDPATGPVLANVIIGLTNAQNASSSYGKQSILISRLSVYSR